MGLSPVAVTVILGNFINESLFYEAISHNEQLLWTQHTHTHTLTHSLTHSHSHTHNAHTHCIYLYYIRYIYYI